MLDTFTIKQGDTLEPITGLLKYGDGTLLTRDLTGATVRFHMRSAAGTLLVDAAAVVIDNTAKRVGYSWALGDTATASPSGQPHQAEFQVTYSDGNIESFPNDKNIKVTVTAQVA